MLIYHPAFDLHNCIYRMLLLIHYMKYEEVELERLRIWDFYLAFPREARNITFPQNLSDLKKVFKSKEANPYEDLVDPKKIMERMKPFQTMALRSLVSYGFIDAEAFEKNVIKKKKYELPLELKNKIENLDNEKMNVIKLVTGFWDLPLFGKHGLKARTGLIDFKYDAR